MYIENSLDALFWECKTKQKVLQEIVRKKYPWFAPFETFRTRARQAWLYSQLKGRWPVAKAGTSYHEKWLAVDRIFLNTKWQPTWKGDYNYVKMISGMCGLVGVAGESCHIQTDKRLIRIVMQNNSDRYKKSKLWREQKLLSELNTCFRKYWFSS